MTETNQLLETILTNTYSTADLRNRLTLLREFLEDYFFTPHEHPNLIFLLNEFFVKKDESRDEFNALNAWGYGLYSQFTKENLYPALDSIEKSAADLPTVTLFLPFAPTPYETPRLGKWLRSNVDPRALMEVKIDISLIGGCAVSYKGIYRDYSLKYYLLRSKVAILKAIGDYVRPGVEIAV
ncbi:MAG: hypothetical protein AAB486_03575 [Patescibacteria group bacterium]